MSHLRADVAVRISTRHALCLQDLDGKLAGGPVVGGGYLQLTAATRGVSAEGLL